MTRMTFKSVAAALLMAVLASALWDFALKAALIKLAEVITIAATLGIRSQIEGIYTEISLSNSQSLSLFLTLMFMTLIISATYGYLGSAKIRFLADDPNFKPNFVARALIAKKITLRTSFNILRLAAITATTMLVIMGARSIYVNGANVALQTFQDSIGPYVSEQTRLEYISRRSRIRTREDFKSLVIELKALAEKNGHPTSYLLIL